MSSLHGCLFSSEAPCQTSWEWPVPVANHQSVAMGTGCIYIHVCKCILSPGQWACDWPQEQAIPRRSDKEPQNRVDIRAVKTLISDRYRGVIVYHTLPTLPTTTHTIRYRFHYSINIFQAEQLFNIVRPLTILCYNSSMNEFFQCN